jgi:hypothetical protein
VRRHICIDPLILLILSTGSQAHRLTDSQAHRLTGSQAPTRRSSRALIRNCRGRRPHEPTRRGGEYRQTIAAADPKLCRSDVALPCSAIRRLDKAAPRPPRVTSIAEHYPSYHTTTTPVIQDNVAEYPELRTLYDPRHVSFSANRKAVQHRR